MLSPFRYEDPLAPGEVVGRDREIGELVERAAAGRNTRLVAPRRYGKTSLAQAAIHEVRDQGGTGLLVDLYGALTVAEVAGRISRALEPNLPRRLVRTLRGRGLDVSLALGPLTVARRPADRPDAQNALLELLELIPQARSSRGRPVLVVFDEFQAILGADKALDASIRSVVQHHADVGYVFAGSHHGMMRDLFANPGRPFYAQAAPLELLPLPRADLASRISGAFADADRDAGPALDIVLDLAAGHPQRAMQLAHHLFRLTASGGQASEQEAGDAIDAALHEADAELHATWEGLARGQRAVLSAVAHDMPPTSARARLEHGTSKGAATPALRELVNRALIDERRSMVDPLMGTWIRRLRA